VLVALLAAVLLLGGCTGPSAGSSAASSTASGAGRSSGAEAPQGGGVDVDTAALRAQKREAGVAACRPGAGSNQLPRLTLRCLGGGKNVDLSTLRGPMVINLFAQWCGPCRAELPYYQTLHRKAAGTVGVLGVDYLDTQPGRALGLVKQTGVTYPLLADPRGELRGPLRIRFTPSIVFLHRDGSVEVVPRSVRSYAELRTLVQQQLDVRLPA
jgi:thiol-disulfide isomerase/thioredoxin